MLLAAGQETMKHACAQADRETREAKEKLLASGVKTFETSAADKPRWSKVFDEVADDWVREGAKRGRPATDREALAKHRD